MALARSPIHKQQSTPITPDQISATYTATPQPESFTLVLLQHTFTQPFTALHILTSLTFLLLLHPVSAHRQRACSTLLSTNLHTAETRSHIRIATAANLAVKQSEHAISFSIPLAAYDRCFNACTPCCTPLANRKHLTVFTIRRYTPTQWALLPICPRVFPAGSGRHTHGAAKRNATWALSRATSSKRSMLATASGGWEGCDAIREL